MPVTNGQGSFSIGRDGDQIILISPVGEVQLNNVVNFKSRQTVTPIKVERLDGINLQDNLPKGWEGSFEIARSDATLERYFSARALAFTSAGDARVSTLYQYITEPDGSQTVIRWDNVALTLQDAGDFAADKPVMQTVAFTANTMTVQ